MTLKRLLISLFVQVLMASLGTALMAQDSTPKKVYKKASPSVVVIIALDESDKPIGLGSGFYIKPNLVATNLHVVRNATTVRVFTAVGRKAKKVKGVYAVSDKHDLALLKMEDAGSALSSAKSRLEVGDPIYAIGNPRGLEATLSTGIISALRVEDATSMYQITAPISPGSSGGPVLNSNSEVVGIATSQYREGQNLNFAVDVKHLKGLVASHLSDKSIGFAAIAPTPKAPVVKRTLADIEGKTGLKFVKIPGGTFQMGSNDALDDEKPVHHVKLDGFWVSKNVVTVGQYEKFCKETKREMPDESVYSNKSNAGWSKKNHPIVNVSWEDAKAYCLWAGVDLPTEAEWEYAARGGLEGKKYPWGDDFDRSKLRCSDKDIGDSGGTSAVGSYPVNGYGLHDMAGNVYQWCKDWYAEKYDTNDTDNPMGAKNGAERVLRGGSWFNDSSPAGTISFRCTYRYRDDPTGRFFIFGFRCVFRLNSR